MKLLIEARFEDEVGEAHTFNLAKIERGELRLGNIGMTIDEGRDLLKRAQHTVAALQTHEFVGKYVVCAPWYRLRQTALSRSVNHRLCELRRVAILHERLCADRKGVSLIVPTFARNQTECGDEAPSDFRSSSAMLIACS